MTHRLPGWRVVGLGDSVPAGSVCGCASYVSLALVASQVQSLQAGRGVLLATGYWNLFKDGAVGRGMGTAYVTASDALTRAVNAEIARVAVAVGARYVDLYPSVQG